MALRQLFKGDEHLLHDFQVRAYADDEVRRFFSTSMGFDAYVEVPDGFVKVMAMDPDDPATLVVLKLDRTMSPLQAWWAVWSLSDGRNLSRTGPVWEFTRRLCREHNVFALDSCVAATNERSLTVTKRLLGDPWGREPKSMWDLGICEFVDAVMFRHLFFDPNQRAPA